MPMPLGNKTGIRRSANDGAGSGGSGGRGRPPGERRQRGLPNVSYEPRSVLRGVDTNLHNALRRSWIGVRDSFAKVHKELDSVRKKALVDGLHSQIELFSNPLHLKWLKERRAAWKREISRMKRANDKDVISLWRERVEALDEIIHIIGKQGHSGDNLRGSVNRILDRQAAARNPVGDRKLISLPTPPGVKKNVVPHPRGQRPPRKRNRGPRDR